MSSRKEDMDVRQLTQLFRYAAGGSLILLGSTAALAGDRPHEQPTRPHQSAVCAPNWGFNQTCWSRFPPVQGCPTSGYDSMPSGYENHPSQQLLYTPQNSLLLPDSQIVAPVYGNSQSPISVFPNSAPQAGVGGMSAMPSADGFSSPAAPPQQFGPSQVPPIPDPRFIPGSPAPGTSSALPPLPSPPTPAPLAPAPGQSLFQPNMIMGPNRQMIVRPDSASPPAIQTSSRYGNARRSATAATRSVSPDSYTNALVANAQLIPMQGQTVPAEHVSPRLAATSSAGSRYGNARLAQQLPTVPQMYAAEHGPALNSGAPGMAQVPVALATQSRVLPGTATSPSYRSGNAMPPESGSSGPQFQPTQLPPAANYRTIPAEPLRRTP
ncbi:MAG: hypothetical protein H7Z17_02950 [Fuerstia sp.]|nr:hypothetical protein [Fuerstiella sp.]